jgi:hypothetical protein
MFPSFKEYHDFHEFNFKNLVTEDAYHKAKNNLFTIEGWVVGVDLNHDIPREKKKYNNFKAYFGTHSKYAAIFYSNQDLKVVAFISWDEKLLIYCPPDKAGHPQNLEEPKAHRNAPGYINYFAPDIEVIYTNDKTMQWEKSSVTELNEKLGAGEAVGVTISSTCTHAPILRTHP